MCRARKAITFLPNAQVATRERGEHGVAVTLADGRVLKGSLLVAAEGRRSPTRDEAGFTPARWDYGHRAIITGPLSRTQPRKRAWEIFYPAGPLRLLPLLDEADGTHRSALVWTVAEKDAAGVLALPESAFLSEVEKRMRHFGKIRLASPRSSYPLNFHHTARIVDTRLALVGDAAHGMHPIAGRASTLACATWRRWSKCCPMVCGWGWTRATRSFWRATNAGARRIPSWWRRRPMC
jgi:2-octaprenyl-6-methoxyphenol hydroxylase